MTARRKRKPGLRIVGALALLAICAVLLYQAGLFIMVLWLKFQNPGSSAFMRATLTELRADNPRAHIVHEWTPYEQISDNLKRAVIASEDSKFVQHDGVEWEAIRKAWEYNTRQAAKGNAKMRGGSTITQQLAKNLFLSPSRSYLRKGQELVLTYMIELTLSKRRILELYLNVAQWGVNVFGAQAAAHHYFGTHAGKLSTYQAARLAVMLPNPSYYDKRRNTSYLRSRTATVQQRMRLVKAP